MTLITEEQKEELYLKFREETLPEVLYLLSYLSEYKEDLFGEYAYAVEEDIESFKFEHTAYPHVDRLVIRKRMSDLCNKISTAVFNDDEPDMDITYYETERYWDDETKTYCTPEGFIELYHVYRVFEYLDTAFDGYPYQPC